MWSDSEYFNASFSIENIESMKPCAFLAHQKTGRFESAA